MTEPQSSRTTSTPKKIKEQSADMEAGGETEQSSTVLKSLLGVSPVMPQKEEDTSSSPVDNGKSLIINDSGFVSMSKSPNRSSLNLSQQPNASSIRGILRSSNPGNNSNLTLQQVIQRIAGGKPSAAPRVTRSRSYSLSDVTSILSPKSKSITIKDPATNRGNLSDLLCATSSVSPKKLPDSQPREGSPESDGGYGTSSAGCSTSPDYNLAQMVRAMKTGSLQPGAAPARVKLPSISELDPAVSHAVKSFPGADMYPPPAPTHYPGGE